MTSFEEEHGSGESGAGAAPVEEGKVSQPGGHGRDDAKHVWLYDHGRVLTTI